MIAFPVVMACASGAFGEASQLVFHGAEADRTRIQIREAAGAAIGGASSGAAAAGDVFAATAASAPSGDVTALLVLDDAGELSLRICTDGSWGAPIAVASGVSVATPAPVAAAYERRSGRLLIAYAIAGSAQPRLRTHDGALSAEHVVDLQLGVTPTRIDLATSSTSDAAVLAAGAAGRIAAALWREDAFLAGETIDSSFDGGALRWDAEWTPRGAPVVVWARAGDTALRYATYDDGVWQLGAGGPSAAEGVVRVALGADPSRSGSTVAAAFASGVSGRLDAAIFDGSAWTGPTLMSDGLAGDAAEGYAFDIAFEGAGGAVVCAWIDDGETRMAARRWDGESWGAEMSSGVIGADGAGVMLGARAEAAGVVAVARRFTAGASDPIGGYGIYSGTGTISTGHGVTIWGLSGSGVDGITMPALPDATAGAAEVQLVHDQTRILDPGAYGGLGFQDRCTLVLSAGTYVFTGVTGSGDDARISCDTSDGEVRIIFTGGNFAAGDRCRLERNGSGAVVLQVMTGSVSIGHDAITDGLIVAHAGNISFGDRANHTGQLFAKGNIGVGHDSVVSAPSWEYPLGASEPGEHTLWGAVITEGVFAGVANLTTTAWSGDAPPPAAIARPVEAARLRVVVWEEAAPD